MENYQTDNSSPGKSPWFAIRLFTLKLKEVEQYFKDKGLTTFVARQWVDYEGTDGRLHHELRPVVRNLIFVECSLSDNELRTLIYDSAYKMSVVKRLEDNKFYRISAREMDEFRIMCNPEINLREYLSEEEARLKPGAEVMVKYGPLKGLSGRLIRISKKYYLLKEVPGMGVALKVSRWCCVPKIQK